MKQREGKTRTVETTQRPAQKRRQEQQNRKTEPPTQDTEGHTGGRRKAQARAKLFETCFLRGSRDGALVLYTCRVQTLDTDPGVATVVLPTASWRVPTPVAPLLRSLSCSRSSTSLWAQWSVRFLIAGSLDRWIAGSLDRLAVAWIPWPEVVLIKSWLDKNTDVHKPAGLPRMRETRICASRACRRRACRRRACRRRAYRRRAFRRVACRRRACRRRAWKNKKIERYFFVPQLVLECVSLLRDLDGTSWKRRLAVARKP